jgi:hypothetical protein
MNLSKIDGCLLGPEIRPHDCCFQKKNMSFSTAN